ncbi:MAG: alpha/beta hydrolase family protein [Gemmataceae bacterium]
MPFLGEETPYTAHPVRRRGTGVALMPDATTFDTFIEKQAEALRAGDKPPATLAEWDARKRRLREAMAVAMGPAPDRPCDLSPRIVGTLRRIGYRIENLLFQSRPDVWVTGSLYVPDGLAGKAPAVLAVHGHWPFARRDPVVQARCLGLVKLGFVALAVDAFSAGERHPTVVKGAYHGALLGGTLWPAGLTLLGVQAYDNRRAVDYLLTRPEVDGTRLGVTGASGGGNQAMYAAALDERFAAAVPVCSVGRYQAYLKAACCVCEVLPSALRFTEEGDVLGLVAPRALMVVNATKDAFQFSVGEAKKSLSRTKDIYKLHDAERKLAHAVFESGHDYSKAMREAMYGWMTRWLKGEGDGKPIPEPAHEVEKVEDLACYPEGKRPAGFVFAPDLAAREAKRMLAGPPDHKEAWDARAVVMRATLEQALGGIPKYTTPVGKTGKPDRSDVTTTPLTLTVEPGLEIAATIRFRPSRARVAAALLLHLDGAAAALKHPLAVALLAKGWAVYAPDLRATGEAKPAHDGIAGAPDHNSAEHAVWVGRPLLGQWAADVRSLLDHMGTRPGLDPRRLSLVGINQAGVVAAVAGALFADRLRSVALVDTLASWVTTAAYPAGTRMGLLAPGVLRAGDVPHLAAVVAPRKLIVTGGFSPAGKKLDATALELAFAFTRGVYKLLKAESAFVVRPEVDVAEVL